MKNFLLSLLIGCASFSVNAQKIEGLGVFKIGMPFSDFESWLRENNVVIEESKSREKRSEVDESQDTRALLILPDDEYEPSSSASFLEGYKGIYVNHYSPNDMMANKVSLLFKKDTLISIGLHPSDSLEEALKAKYGKGVETSKTEEITCVYTYSGATKKESNLTHFLTWRDDKDIKSYLATRFWFDSKCKEHSFKLLNITDKKKYADYDKKNYAAQMRFYEVKEKKKIDLLKKSLDKL